MAGVVRLQLVTLKLLCLSVCLLSESGVTLGDKHAVVRVVAAEGSDVILPCSLPSKENIESKLFDWRKVPQKDELKKEVFLYDAGVHYNNGRSGQSEEFKGRVSHFPDQLKYGNASVSIRNTRVSDHGNYTCYFPRLHQMFYIELVVDCDPQCSTLKNKYGEIDGAAEPYISIVDVMEVGVQLKCDVRGVFPQQELRWRECDGSPLHAEEPRVSERGRRYDVTLPITVNRTATNCFSCVVTQENISHMVEANFTVPEKLFKDASCKVDVIAWCVGFFVGVIFVVVVVALYKAVMFITISCKRGPSSSPVWFLAGRNPSPPGSPEKGPLPQKEDNAEKPLDPLLECLSVSQ